MDKSCIFISEMKAFNIVFQNLTLVQNGFVESAPGLWTTALVRSSCSVDLLYRAYWQRTWTKAVYKRCKNNKYNSIAQYWCLCYNDISRWPGFINRRPEWNIKYLESIIESSSAIIDWSVCMGTKIQVQKGNCEKIAHKGQTEVAECGIHQLNRF